eukprot:TRINITY_DN11309_c0_g1_i1.p1 TRINITY_DN11309_c0_g1~~TRINITY_DN11309_c0_g1_i1.p1  ORF type:complete len:554 (-),score=66.98 TRINITY_DN11309_c0_g1_i1:65-1627(-)
MNLSVFLLLLLSLNLLCTTPVCAFWDDSASTSTSSRALTELAKENKNTLILLSFSRQRCDSCEILEHELFPRLRELYSSFCTASDDEVRFTVLRVSDTMDPLLGDPALVPFVDTLRAEGSLLLFAKKSETSRECLLNHVPPRSRLHLYSGERTLDDIVAFIQDTILIFMSSTGDRSDEGIRAEHLLTSTFIPTAENNSCALFIGEPSEAEFFEMVASSRPTVIRGATNSWNARTKWTNEYLLSRFGDIEITVKVNPGGDFEGCEEASLWDDYETMELPARVLEQLESPHLVVTRPADLTLPMRDFVDLLPRSAELNATFYLEYFPIHEIGDMISDVNPFPWAETLLTRAQFNVWMGDGKTLGKLHFDPFDNLLALIAGEKNLTLYHPHHNEALYEGHIREARFEYEAETSTFARSNLLESTSMVMSPVNIRNPNFTNYPLFSDIAPTAVHCTVEEGDVLYLPSFWWHEVQSTPDISQRNIAVNYWFNPFYEKEFPCPHCRLKINSDYSHLLRKYSRKVAV